MIRISTALGICLAITALAMSPACAQDAGAGAPVDVEKFEKQSGALRTALHYDPSLEAPLKSLAKLYGDAGRSEGLLSIYRTHAAQYPQDESARVVLIRLLREMRKPEAQAMVAKARKDFPGSALVAYLAFQEFDREKDPRALDALSEAISAETKPGRKRLWIDQLVDLSIAEGRADLATKHLSELAEVPGQSAEFLLSVARKMHKAKFHELVLKTLGKAREINTSPELNIDIELVAAAAEASLKRYLEAGERLDALLEIVSADYWRRPEIVSRRVNLLRTDAAREQMLKESLSRFEAEPANESAALDLSELQVACELRRDALATLLAASESLPNSERIETAILGLFDRLNDLGGARDYLKLRLERNPDRLDLDYRYVKALFASGAGTAASERFESLLQKIEESSRLDQSLDLARYLRRMGLTGGASKWFERVVEQAPERLDVRRELAETLLVIGRRKAARDLFTAELADGAQIENFIDVVQFMIQQDILLEAKKAIGKRLAVDGENFELRLMLIDVHGKLGDQAEGERLLESSRGLADTGARYRNWSESAAKFHELFETLEGFFDTEQARLVGAGGEWTPRRVTRLLVFCDIADRSQERSRVVEVVRAQIDSGDTPADLRLELRRLLVRLLERDPGSVAELEVQLAALEEEDSDRSDEYRLRMSKMYLAAQRSDLASPFLEGIDFSKIGDSRLLGGLHMIYLNRGEPRKALDVLERIAGLEPTNRANWETWLTHLAALGEEGELRQAIRRLIIGIDRMPLAEDTYALLRGHLVDSYWRTIAHKLASGEDERHGEIFSLLDAIERSGGLPAEQLWVLWTRAHVLGLQGRDRARDEAVEQLERTAATLAEKGGEIERQGKARGAGEEEEAMIYFPDGLAVSIDAAIMILREPPVVSPASAAPKVDGPLPGLQADWAFETNGRAAVIQTLPIASGDVFVLDRKGTIYRVSGDSGKLVWATTANELAKSVLGGEPTIPVSVARRSRSSSHSRPVAAQLLPQCVADADGNLVVPFHGQLVCLSAADGKPRWIGQMGGEAAEDHGITSPLLLFMDGDQVLAYNRATAVAAAFDRRSGKLIWEREILSTRAAGEAPKNYLFTDFSSGASFSDGRLLVYGRHSAIIETVGGKTIWSFEAGGGRRFPIRLPAPDDETLGGSLMPSGGRWSSQTRGSSSFGGRFRSSQQRAPAAVNYLAAQQNPSSFVSKGGALVAPAARWAQSMQSGQQGMGVLSGKRMLLFGPDIQVHSLELPLAGSRRNLYRHAFIGVSGNKACFVGGQQLAILNLSRNTLITADLSEVVESSPLELQVTLAGARVYASGRNGILCINLHTGGEIYHSPWPEVISRFYLPGAGDKVGRKRATNQAEYHWQGRIPIAPAARPSRANSAPAQQLAPGWQPIFTSRQISTQLMRPCFPISNAVSAGRLFALVSPYQLVALSHAGDRPNPNSSSDASEPKN